MNRDNLLIVGDSERDPDMLYAVGVPVPESMAYLRLGGRHLIAVDDLRAANLRRHARHCRILPLSRFNKGLTKSGGSLSGMAGIIREILRKHRIKKIVVPYNFPHGLARQLRRMGLKLKAGTEPFFPSREFKTADEVKKINAAVMMAEVGLAEGLLALKGARVDKSRRLIYRHTPLTVERLRAIMQTAIMQAGGVVCHPVVMAGRRGGSPNSNGQLTLKANEPILIDLFPRSIKTGYFGELARTVVKGRAGEEVRRMFNTVIAAEAAAVEKATAGTPATAAHQAAAGVFAKEGFKTLRRNGQCRGFCRQLGHGIGLELHELPNIGPDSADILCDGHVITIEPGLVYPEIGEVRVADVLLINGSRPKNLTRFEKTLEI